MFHLEPTPTSLKVIQRKIFGIMGKDCQSYEKQNGKQDEGKGRLTGFDFNKYP
jgi:hypothetical protein